MTDSRVTSLRLLAGLAGLALCGAAVHRDSIGAREARLFRLVNEQPEEFYRPIWVVMQLGNVAAGPVTAGLAYAAGRPRLARRLLVDGLTVWALSKLLKRAYRRPRPGVLLDGIRSRGPEQSGLGYVSGHAGIAVALAMAVAPELGARRCAAVLVAAPAVGLSRIYIGAHLPLDVLGGAALGVAVDAAAARWLR